MSQLDAKFVKTGFWIDNTRGSTMGRTITTDTQTGNIVVALMAVLTTVGIKSLWNLTLFVYHQLRVNDKPADGLYRQQQAVMRTLTGPASMVSDWLKLWWIWRKRIDRTLLRSLPLFVLAIIFAIATIVVGIFSSYLVDSTDIVILVSSPHCGLLTYNFENSDTVTRYYENIAESTSQYVRDCYTNQMATPERCRIFVRPTIMSHQERVECPFEQTMCKNIFLPGLSFDTGLLDLNEYYGLNLAAGDRMKFRQKTTCAILDLEGHYDVTDKSNSTSLDLNETVGRDIYNEEAIIRVYLGETFKGNVTEKISSMPLEGQSITASPWINFSSIIESDRMIYNPIHQLQDSHSDLRLVLMKISLHFQTPVDDPLFSAHRQLANGLNQTMYVTDDPVAAFACQHQYQFCSTYDNHTDQCTPLQGLRWPPDASNFPSANEVQLAVFELLTKLSFTIFGLSILEMDLSPVKVTDMINAPLPNDQWVQQLTVLNNIGISNMQTGLEANSLGLSNLGLEETLPMEQNATAAQRSLCNSQRMRSPGGFVNINVFALAFVSTFCVLITALDLFLLKFLVYSDTMRGLLAPRINSWVQDGVLQFQRRAYEAHGEGCWERLDKEVPATTDDIQLATLPTVSKLPCNCSAAASLLGKPPSTGSIVTSNPPSVLNNEQSEVTTPALPAEQNTTNELTDLTAISLNGPPMRTS